jgi:hypothetical protein
MHFVSLSRLFHPLSVMMATSDSFLGTWKFFVGGDIACHGLISFDRQGRLLQCVTEDEKPDQTHWFRLFFEVESPGVMRIRHKPDTNGWIRGFQFNENGFVMTSDKIGWLMEKVHEAEIPEWFQIEWMQGWPA